MSPAVLHFSDPLPAAVTDRPPPARAIGAPPLRSTREVYAAAAAGLSIGEWSCEPGSWTIAFHTHRHEFFHVLEGRLRLRDEAGRTREFGPGDACVIPAGFRGIFEVLEAVRKRYVMVDLPVDGETEAQR